MTWCVDWYRGHLCRAEKRRLYETELAREASAEDSSRRKRGDQPGDGFDHRRDRAADSDLPVEVGLALGERTIHQGHARHRQQPRQRHPRRQLAQHAMLLLLTFTLVAAVTDALWKKIYNWNTYGGIVVALV